MEIEKVATELRQVAFLDRFYNTNSLLKETKMHGRIDRWPLYYKTGLTV